MVFFSISSRLSLVILTLLTTTILASTSVAPQTTTTTTRGTTRNPWNTTPTTTPYCPTITSTLTTGCPTFVPLGCPAPDICTGNSTNVYTVPCGCPTAIPIITSTVQCPNGCERYRSCRDVYSTPLACPGGPITVTPITLTSTTPTPTSSPSPWNSCPTFTSSVWEAFSDWPASLTIPSDNVFHCDWWTRIDIPCGCPTTVPIITQYVTAAWSCGTQPWSPRTATVCGSTSITTTSSTPTLKSTTTTTTSTRTGYEGPLLPKYAQCGGQFWQGPGICVRGTTCVYSNPWYSQCL